MVISYGKFIQTVIDFIIIAAAVFVGVKAINQLQQQKQAAPTAPSNEEKLLSEIRDLLKSQSR